jgi:hypothetical protein
MTKLIAAAVIVAFLLGFYGLIEWYAKVKNDTETARKEEAAAVIVPEQLPGMPYQLEASLQTATKLGPTGLRNWLKAYGSKIQDPRKAWIELDFCVMVSREDPSEARRVFAEVKARTPDSSPVYKRMKELEKTYQ